MIVDRLWMITVYPVRVVGAWTAWLVVSVGYWIRPYDMLADGLAQMVTSTHQHLQAFAARHRPRAQPTRAALVHMAESIQLEREARDV